MNAIYNENDPFAADWLERLVERDLIAPGRVDRRSIVDVDAADVAGPGQRHFFAGIGGWQYALRLAGVPDTADVWTGSCPCQPFSVAGARGGFSDPRHLWPAWFRLIEQCRPTVVFGEQVAGRAGLAWLDLVRADLEGCGYSLGASDLCAASVGAPHRRQRLFFVAHAAGVQRHGWSTTTGRQTRSVATRGGGRLGYTGGDGDRQHARELSSDEGQRAFRTPDSHNAPVDTGPARNPWSPCDWVQCSDGVSRPVGPGTFPLAHGVPARVGRLRGYGNAIVAEVAATFIRAAVEAIGSP